MIRRILITSTLAALPFALAACGSSLPDDTAARVGDIAIPKEEIQRVIDQQRAQAEQSNTNFAAPDSPEELELRRNLLNQAITQRITSLEAAACGKPCLATNAEINRRLNTIIKENFKGKKADFQKFIKESGLSDDDVRQIIQFEIEGEKRRARLSKGIRYSRAEAIKYCTANPGQFKQPEQRTASHILVRRKDVAERVRSQATPENFADLAATYSIDTGSKGRGGNLGPLTRGVMVAPFEQAAFRLRDGEISAPVKTQFGWHVILVDVTPARDIPCAEAAAGIQQQQLLTKRQEAFDRWLEGAKKKYEGKIIYASDDLKIPPPSATPPVPTGAPQPAAPQPAAPQAP